MKTVFDSIPLWLLFVATVATTLLAVEVGFRAGVHRARQSEDERQAPIDTMVGSTLGLLAFVLAFTFGMAASRYDARSAMVLNDVLAIRTVDLRAQQLAEPHRAEIRALVREYVDVRVGVVRATHELPQAIARSEELQDQLWSRVATLGPQTALAQALVDMIDMHTKRVSVALGNRIPGTIWIALYCLTISSMAIMGYRKGIAGRRSVVVTFTLVLAFSMVILVIVDLDRPLEGFLQVGQQAMFDLQTRLHRP